MHIQLKVLQQRLGEFGLDPLDWCIEVLGQRGTLTLLEITSLVDRGVRMEGWAYKGAWISLELREI